MEPVLLNYVALFYLFFVLLCVQAVVALPARMCWTEKFEEAAAMRSAGDRAGRIAAATVRATGRESLCAPTLAALLLLLLLRWPRPKLLGVVDGSCDTVQSMERFACGLPCRMLCIIDHRLH